MLPEGNRLTLTTEKELEIASKKLHVGERIIETTDNHPFWVEDKGWLFADELKAGDRLQKADGSNLKIEKVEFVKLDNPITVYNFTVADYHTYYVTDLGIWVHNTMCAWVPGFKPLGRGSTGRTTPKNDRELKAMQKAMTTPGKGEILKMPAGMQDNRWRKEEGWVKMSREVNGVEIHWVYNLQTRRYDDFKFKDR